MKSNSHISWMSLESFLFTSLLTTYWVYWNRHLARSPPFLSLLVCSFPSLKYTNLITSLPYFIPQKFLNTWKVFSLPVLFTPTQVFEYTVCVHAYALLSRLFLLHGVCFLFSLGKSYSYFRSIPGWSLPSSSGSHSLGRVLAALCSIVIICLSVCLLV